MTAGESPELNADGHLNGCEREILLLLSRLKLNQNLMELHKKISRHLMPNTCFFIFTVY